MNNAPQFRVLALLGLAVGTAFAAVAVRLIDIQVRRHDELRTKAERYTRTHRSMEPWRGEVLDCRGRTLVTSLPVKTVFADLTVSSNRIPEVAAVIAPALGMTATGVAAVLRRAIAGPCGSAAAASHAADPSPRPSPLRGERVAKAGEGERFTVPGRYKGQQVALQAILLRRSVPLWGWEGLTNALARASFGLPTNDLDRRQRLALDRLRRRAVFSRDDQVRIYPLTNVLGPVLGFVLPGPGGVGLEGVAGLELSLNGLLGGVRGVCDSDQDAAGRELPFGRTRWTPAVDGSHVHLTIDVTIQQSVERILASAVARHEPRAASVIVLRPRTGEIVAWASSPVANPARPAAGPSDVWRISGLSDRLEPGSVLKVLVVAGALEHGTATLDRRLFCERGRLRFPGGSLRDHANYETLTVRDILAKSSNIGAAKLAFELGHQRLHEVFLRFGLGQRTGLPLLGETPGYLPLATNRAPQVLACAAIGQGVALSQMQLTLAVAALANDGRLMRPHLVKEVRSPEGKLTYQSRPAVVRQAVRPEVARSLVEAMRGVVAEGGTGLRAQPEFYTAGGKTGTAQKASAHGYLAGKYTAWFAGFAPATNPALVVSVMFDEPRHGYYGGEVCAPVFRAVIDEVAPRLGIPADRGAARTGSNLASSTR